MMTAINAFPGYEYVDGKNMFRGEDVGKGGYVYSKPGMYIGRIVTFDVMSMHPFSVRELRLFGSYTPIFNDLVDARAAIKHKDFDKARRLFDGKLAPYLNDETTAKQLAQALKIAINSVYGLTSASFDNPFRDIRNSNNIVALRGALFMVTLRDEVEKRGFKVVHIKTDSIKIFNPTSELEQFVMDFGEQYGYKFEIENIFDRICLIDKAQYIAHTAPDDPEEPNTWHPKGDLFLTPYIFKTLFSHEPLEFGDLTEVKSVSTSLYLDTNEDLPADEHDYHFIGKVGLFVPIKPGCGGGELVAQREKKGVISYDSANGAKGYRWLEAETVKQLGKEGDVDYGYFNELAGKALDAIRKVGGDYDILVGNAVAVADTPPWTPPCGDGKYEDCLECECYQCGECNKGCDLSNYIHTKT